MFEPFLNRRFFYDLLFGESRVIPNLRMGRDELYDEGLTMGTFIIGKPGTGKTTWLAQHILSYFHRHPNHPIFILDWSGSISNILLDLISRESQSQAEKDLDRIIYAELGHPSTIVPLPEFSHLYGNPFDAQIRRVQKNLDSLAQMYNSEILGGVLINGLIPRVLEVLTSIGNTPQDIWQITELGMVLNYPKKYLPALFSAWSGKISEKTKEVLLKRLINVPGREGELRTYVDSKLQIPITSTALQPALGYYRPGWTPREAIRNGNLVLMNGWRLVGQDVIQHYAFTQIHSLIMDEINQRNPGIEDGHILYVLDEVLTAKDNPGMADDLSKLPSQYRNRGVCLHLCGQGLWQFNEDLQKAIWNMGNMICFSLDDYNDGFALAQQLSTYHPQMMKNIPSFHRYAESDKGQTVIFTNFIQNLRKRECLIRRYWTESERDPRIIHVRKTKEVTGNPREPIDAIKERLLKRRGIVVSEALRVINERKLPDVKQEKLEKV